jgi:hypothetical protein
MKSCPKVCQVWYYNFDQSGTPTPSEDYDFKTWNGTTFDTATVTSDLAGLLDLQEVADAINASNVNVSATVVEGSDTIKLVFHMSCAAVAAALPGGIPASSTTTAVAPVVITVTSLAI